MGLVGAIVAVLLAVDLIVGFSLLAVVAVEYRRQRRIARDAGEPVPARGIGQFLFLGAGLLLSTALYIVLLLLLTE